MEKPIFILGLPRSGSTLWHNIITVNPNIFRIAEMHFFNPWHKDFRYFCRKYVGDLSIDQNVKKMIDLIFSHDSIKGLHGVFWKNDIEKVDDPELREIINVRILKSDRSLNSIFKILIEEITYFSGLNRCCVKFPVFLNYVPKLVEWYPECKVVHITRDPRAVAMSKTNDPGGTNRQISKHPYLKYIIRKKMIFFVIIQFIWTSILHRKYGKYKHYTLLRYEDLLEDTETVIKKLCKFTEVEFIPAMLNPKKGQASSLTGKKESKIDINAVSRWKTVITPFENNIITFFTKRSRKIFGYDT